MSNFAKQPVESWNDFLKIAERFQDEDGWVFRGQTKDLPLKTSLERAIEEWEIDASRAPAIEEELRRDFRRKYAGYDRNLVTDDPLYCLALMQHYGAPTRLLDFTYSIFVALHFAVRSYSGNSDEARNDSTATKIEHHGGRSTPVIWGINGNWTGTKAEQSDNTHRLKKDRSDSERGGEVFKEVYLSNRSQFVHHENPLLLNERLIIQQGVFVCPANISVPFESNLRAMDGWGNKSNIVKLMLPQENNHRLDFLKRLHRMNISQASLFPGLQGFSESFSHRIWLYDSISKRRRN